MTNNKFENYKFEDFITNKSFCNFTKGKNADDIAFWENWLASNPENIAIAKNAQEIIKITKINKQKLPLEFINNEWKKLNDNLESNNKKGNSNIFRITQFKVWKYAAAIIFLISVLSGLLFSDLIFNDSIDVTYVEINVPNGKIKHIFLPDSTSVTINSGSMLKYASNYGNENRKIILEGEAFFDVKYNSAKPFIVHTSDNIIKVLGTTFNVMAYTNENIHKISLEKGEIKISNLEGYSDILKPNQIYLLLRNKKEYKIIETSNITKNSSWKDGKIIFKNQRFIDIAQKLERYHNVTFRIENKKIKKCRYTGEFSINDSISKILKIINTTTPFEYKIINDTIIIE